MGLTTNINPILMGEEHLLLIQEWNNNIKDTHTFDLAAKYLNFDDGWLL